jgi:7-cyano-7-deazaguanine synthase
MDDDIVRQIAFANLPSRCALTQRDTDDPVVMHRDLSDWFDDGLKDIRDERVANLIIVDRRARANYYNKLKSMQVVLAYSGGLDSATVLHWCLKVFGSVRCLIFDYGQRHSIEVQKACSYLDNIEEKGYNIEGRTVDMKAISNLTSSSCALTGCASVPKGRNTNDMADGIPNTFVPGRNVYFLTALAQEAYRIGGRHIAVGMNILDYSGYPDCRPEFLTHMRNALRVGVFNGTDIGVHAPLMYMNKTQIIRLGKALGVNYGMTHSCYEGVDGGCGECDSCVLRRKAFDDLGEQDPAMLLANT